MFRFRLRTLFLAVTILSIIVCIVVAISRFDDPIAVVVVSRDAKMSFTPDAVLKLTESAMRDAGIVPVKPFSYRDGNDDERFLGRNSFHPDDRVTVIWSAGPCGSEFYGVALDRQQSQITATIHHCL